MCRTVRTMLHLMRTMPHWLHSTVTFHKFAGAEEGPSDEEEVQLAGKSSPFAGGVYTHTCIYIHTYTHMHIHTHTYTHMHIHTHHTSHAYTHMHTHAYTYTHMHIHTHTYTYIHMRTHTHTCIYIHTTSHTYTHMHTYTALRTRQFQSRCIGCCVPRRCKPAKSSRKVHSMTMPQRSLDKHRNTDEAHTTINYSCWAALNETMTSTNGLACKNLAQPCSRHATTTPRCVCVPAIKEGKNLADLPPPPASSVPDNRVPCPYCVSRCIPVSGGGGHASFALSYADSFSYFLGPFVYLFGPVEYLFDPFAYSLGLFVYLALLRTYLALLCTYLALLCTG
jgi:hypothetical protein